MNPLLSEMAKRIQEKANTFIPQAYGMGRAKVQEKYSAVKPWGLQDTVNVELLLNRHAEELSRAMVKIEQAAAEGVGIDILLDQFLNRVGAWAWVLSPALASGMAAGIDSGRTEIGQEEGLQSNDIGIIWLTAEDTRVCDKCLYMAGRWFEAKNAYEIAASIHPGCRCPAHFDVGVPSDAMVGPVPSYQPGTADMVYRDLHADSLIKQRWERARRPAMATPQPMAPIPV